MATKKPVNLEPVEMVSLRDVRIANTSGHCVWMKANVPQTVPGPLVDTALEMGCVPSTATVYEDHKAKLERQMRERTELIETLISGITALVKKNDLNDFTPTGHPKLEVLADICDVDPNLVTMELRDHAFAEWNTRNRRGGAGKSKPKKDDAQSAPAESAPE